MKFLKRLILSEKLEHIPKDLEIRTLNYSEVPVVSKGVEDYIISNANVNNPKAMQLLLNYSTNKIFTLIQKDSNWKDPKKRIWAEAEKKITLDPRAAFSYASEVIKDQIQEDPTRWSEGEKTIATNEEYSYKYATEIIKDQILSDSNWKDPEKRRWTEGEKIIAKSKQYAYNYGFYIIKDQIKQDPDRWREGEQTIATYLFVEPSKIFAYATMIKDQLIADPNRWPKGIKILARDVNYIPKYAEMTKRPFPEGEEYLIQFGGYRADYKDFIKKNWDSFTNDQKKRINPVFLKN